MRLLAGPGLAEIMVLYGELLSRNNSGKVTPDEIIQLDFVHSGTTNLMRLTHVATKRVVWIKPKGDTMSIWFGKDPKNGPHSLLPDSHVDPDVNESFSLKVIQISENFLLKNTLPDNVFKGHSAK